MGRHILHGIRLGVLRIHPQMTRSPVLFGRRGALLTAAHVGDDATHELAVALAAADGTWRMWSLQPVERHPNEDVAVGIVPLPTESVPESPIQLSTDGHHSSGEWMVWDIQRTRCMTS